MKKAYFVCPILLFAMTAFAQNNFVYTNDNFSPNTVSVFKVSPSNGALTLIPGSPFLTGGNGGGNDVNAENITTATQGTASFLYAANNGSSTVSAFAINPKIGALAPVPGSPFHVGPNTSGSTMSLTASPNGKFLFQVDESSTFIRTFNIAANGVITEAAGSPFDTGAEPEGLKVTANGNFLLVGLRSLDALGVYSIDANGALIPVPGSPFLTNGPRRSHGQYLRQQPRVRFKRGIGPDRRFRYGTRRQPHSCSWIAIPQRRHQHHQRAYSQSKQSGIADQRRFQF